jgi:hypothetical protein
VIAEAAVKEYLARAWNSLLVGSRQWLQQHSKDSQSDDFAPPRRKTPQVPSFDNDVGEYNFYL